MLVNERPKFPSEFSSKILAVLYIFVASPILLSLCFATAPFQVPDETAHFLRADQLSLGTAEPLLAPGAKAAGGYVDSSAEAVITRLGNDKINFDPSHRFQLGDVWPLEDADPGQPPVFEQFSNTVIYFPTAHLVPALSIVLVKQFTPFSLAWFYAARVGNALVAVVLSAFAIFTFEESALFAFIFCLLPMVLFEEGSVSTDALVIPCSILFASLLGKLSRRLVLHRTFFIMMFIVILFVCVSKFAYMPLAVLPPAIAAFQVRNRLEIFKLSFITLISIAIWFSWSIFVHTKVFTVGHHQGIVDVNKQLSYIFSNPKEFLLVMYHSVWYGSFGLLKGMVGAKLGWLDVAMPKISVGLSLVVLAAVILLRRSIPEISILSRLSVCLLVFTSLIAAYVLLYLQFTPVGAPTVDGIQGRYWLPLLAFVPLAFPGLMHLRSKWQARLSVIVIAISGCNAIGTVVVVWLAYW